MPTIEAGSISKGMYILFRNQPNVVVKAEFYHPGKGATVNRIKYKNITTGTIVDFTHRTNERVEYIDVESTEMQFLYADGGDLVFMDPRSYEQVNVPAKLIEPFQAQLLTPDTKAYVISYDEKPLALSLPPKMKLKVVDSPNAVAGNTVGKAKKTVTLESGYQTLAPLFVKTGDTLVIDTETGNYVKRD